MNFLPGFLIVMATSVAATIALIFSVRRLPLAKSLRDNNDIAGIYFTIVGTIYAIIMAFMLASVWTRFDQARTQAEQEAIALVNIYHLADGLTPSTCIPIQKAARAYGLAVIDKEWPAMQQGIASPETADLHHRLWSLVQQISPRNNHEENIYSQLLQQLTNLATSRRLRLLVSDSGLPKILWFVLVLGAVLLVSMTALFGVETVAHHTLKASLLTVMIVLVLYATWEIDGPFSGDVVVPPTAFQEAVNACAEPATAPPESAPK